MKNTPSRDRRGFALILALLATSVTVILMIAYISRVVADYAFTAKIYDSTVALDLAEAGAERAIWEIRYNDKAAAFTVPLCALQSSTGDSMGEYEVSVVFPDSRTSIITSSGYVPTKSSYKAKKTVKIKYVNYNFNVAIGAGGTGGITLGKNSIVDSYNSDPLNPGDPPRTYDDTHTNSDGNIATNGPITIPHNSDVYGDANPGADYPFSSQPAGVTGSWGTLQAPLVYEPIPTETLSAQKALGLAAPAHGVITEAESGSYTRIGDNLVVSKTITLTGGSYYFKSITVNTQANIIIDGQSTIYVDGGNLVVGTQGDMNVTGSATFYIDGGDINVNTQGDINTGGAPKNLMIYSTGDNITLITQTDFFGAIYAPNAAISLTSKTAGGEIYGAIVCDSFVSGTNTAVHFDKALLNISPVFANNGVIYWQES